MTHILAYRFSAFGDVAMLVPVFKEFLVQNPHVKITFVSRKNFEPLFAGIPNLAFYGVDLILYKGFWGLRKLSLELQQFQPDCIADFHNVLRTNLLNFFFRLSGFKIAQLDKGKQDKKRLTSIYNVHKKPLKPNTERYADVLRKMGFKIQLSHQLPQNSNFKNGIGIAPFAQHKGKMLPLDKTFSLAKKLSETHKVYFFGGGRSEVEELNDWERKIPNSENLAGKLTLTQELEKISTLEAMISMDSANMHLASLCGTRVISLWGATHHFAGFLGYGQSTDDIVEVKDLTCRPCSVFGNKPCYRGDYACLNELSVNAVLSKL